MKLSEVTKKYWEEKDYKDLDSAKTIADLYMIALRIIDRMPKPLVQVCGPIAETGGLGSVEANLNLFCNTVIDLQNKGLNVFDQMFFEKLFLDFYHKLPDKEFVKKILNDFYLPIFESGVVTKFYFIPNWESSSGANWEHEKAKELGIEINYL